MHKEVHETNLDATTKAAKMANLETRFVAIREAVLKGKIKFAHQADMENTLREINEAIEKTKTTDNAPRKEALISKNPSDHAFSQDRLRVQGSTRIAISITNSIFSWLLPSGEAEREANECAEIFIYSLKKARVKRGISGTVRLLWLYISFPLGAVRGAWVHRARLARRREGK
jgi:hypothetical protein